ncbi:MAG: VIT1/CCC1 transporter family protein [Candidatus Omnitrophota bacterium]
MDKKILDAVLKAQRNEITEYHIYAGLAKQITDTHNREILEKIAKDEKEHCQFWKTLSGRDIEPDRIMVFWYIFLSKIFGLSFALKLMEKGEILSADAYQQLKNHFPQTSALVIDEQKHEKELLSILKEERVEYAGSVVLGLNDALVELTGALTGLTFALQNGKIIAVTGLITGIAASMSMAASGYLSSKEEADQNEEKSPLKSAFYTGVAYLVTVFLLIVPYFVFSNLYVALASMLSMSILIIFGYTFYITTAKGLKFWRRFIEMAAISLSVAFISFGVGTILKKLIGIEI